jgi:hypothetical protein
MKVVGSAPRDDIDLTGPAAPVLSIVAAGDHLCDSLTRGGKNSDRDRAGKTNI